MPVILITAIAATAAYIGSLTTNAVQPSPVYNVPANNSISTTNIVIFSGLALAALYVYKKVN